MAHVRGERVILAPTMRSPLPAVLSVVALAAALCTAAPATGATPAPTTTPATEAPAYDPDGFAPLSNERTLSRWAHAEETSVARRGPSTSARRVGRLRLDTEDGLPEVYLALERYRGPDGRLWVKVRLPARPNGQTGWVPRGALGKLRRTTLALRIDRKTKRATLRRSGKLIWRARVGVGKRSTPTPAGRFYVRVRLIPAAKSIYGKLAFGLSAYASDSEWPGGGVVGVHGTDQPELIPGSPSAGCVRVRATDLRRLGRLLEIGTPVRID